MLWVPSVVTYYKFCARGRDRRSMQDKNWLTNWVSDIHTYIVWIIYEACNRILELTTIGSSPHLPALKWNSWIATIIQTGSFSKFIALIFICSGNHKHMTNLLRRRSASPNHNDATSGRLRCDLGGNSGSQTLCHAWRKWQPKWNL